MIRFMVFTDEASTREEPRSMNLDVIRWYCNNNWFEDNNQKTDTYGRSDYKNENDRGVLIARNDTLFLKRTSKQCISIEIIYNDPILTISINEDLSTSYERQKKNDEYSSNY